MSSLKILTYNIHGGYDMRGRRDLRRLNMLLDELDVDIAVLQEMETRLSSGGRIEDIAILAGETRPHYQAAPTIKNSDGWYGNLIVSRYPILRGLVHNLDTKPIFEPRNALDALIQCPEGNIRIIGTHLSISSTMSWSEINNLIKLVNEVEDETYCPVFFMGDYNEWVWSSRLIKHLDELFIPLKCGKTFPSFCPVFRLDRAWCDNPKIHAHARVIRTDVTKTLSDHLPVLIEVEDLQRQTPCED